MIFLSDRPSASTRTAFGVLLQAAKLRALKNEIYFPAAAVGSVPDGKLAKHDSRRVFDERLAPNLDQCFF